MAVALSTQAGANHIDTSQVPGTVQLVDLDVHLHLRHARGHKDIILVPTPSADPDDPLNWSPGRKRLALTCILAYTWFNGMALSVVYSVEMQLAEALEVSVASINAGTGYFFLLCGWGLLFWQPFALQYGKRVTYIVSLVAIVAVSVWSPYAKGEGQWIARNIVIGFVAAPIEALPETSITDLYFAHERGTYLGWYAWFLASSNFFAPVITGFINDSMGYKWCFFFQAIFSAVVSVFLFFFLEETNYDRKTVGVVEGTSSPEPPDADAADGVGEKKRGQENTEAQQIPSNNLIAGSSTLHKPKTYRQKLALIDKPRTFKMHWRAWQILKLLSWPVIFYAGFSYGTYLVWFNILNATASLILGGAPYNFLLRLRSPPTGVILHLVLCPTAVATSHNGQFDASTDLLLDHSTTALQLTERGALDHQPDSETIAAYSVSGQCFTYLGHAFPNDVNEGWNRTKELEPCKNYCVADETSNGYGCIAPNITSTSQLDPSLIYEDDAGLHWTPGTCHCDYELAEAMFEIIAEGLSKLDMVFCSILISIFTEAIEVGTMFMPGADLLDATELAITVAKTADQNALGPLDYFNNWMNTQCGMTGIGLDPVSLFAILVGASDSLGTSRGCSRRNPAACVKPKPNTAPAKDIPRSDPKDPWEGETPPTSDIPVACANTRLGLLQTRTKCKPTPDVEGEGYTYKDLGGKGFYEAGTWSIKCPSKLGNGQLDDIAVLNIDKENGVLNVDIAKLDADGPDSIGKLSLRDMIAGIWQSKGNGGIATINKIVHLTVVEKGWKGKDLADEGKRGVVQKLMGKGPFDEYSMRVDSTGNEKKAFDVVMKETSQGVGVFKLLEEYAGGAGRQVTLIEIKRGGGQDDIHFTIGEGSTA